VRSPRVYEGLFRPIRLPAEAITPAPRLHREAEPFPFAAVARKLEPSRRDRFAGEALRLAPIYEEAKRHQVVGRIIASA